ncbi:hypothetical protein, partial [Burkholderia pseudomallei]|uniref:hypothetical protein n=1 Tax=Burkholderia pseudomallei TaxID=28450 RepID=UPI001F2703C7
RGARFITGSRHNRDADAASPAWHGSAPGPFVQRLRFAVTCLHHGRRFALVHATGEKHRRSVRAD